MARPRCAGPTMSIFMITVVDQVRPWFTPSSMLATMTHDQLGAQMRMRVTGMPMSQPPRRTGLRPYRSEGVPAKKSGAAFLMPKEAAKGRGGEDRGEGEEGSVRVRSKCTH